MPILAVPIDVDLSEVLHIPVTEEQPAVVFKIVPLEWFSIEKISEYTTMNLSPDIMANPDERRKVEAAFADLILDWNVTEDVHDPETGDPTGATTPILPPSKKRGNIWKVPVILLTTAIQEAARRMDIEPPLANGSPSSPDSTLPKSDQPSMNGTPSTTPTVPLTEQQIVALETAGLAPTPSQAG